LDQNVTITINNFDSRMLEAIMAALSPYGILLQYTGSATNRRIVVDLRPIQQPFGEMRLTWMDDVQRAIISASDSECSIEFDWRLPDLPMSIDAGLALDCQAAMPIGAAFTIRLPHINSEDHPAVSGTKQDHVTLMATMVENALVLWLPDCRGQPATCLTIENIDGHIIACVAGNDMLAFHHDDIAESRRAVSIGTLTLI
jgi:hypothetical protein